MQNYKKILSSLVIGLAVAAAAPAFAQDLETQGVKGTSPIISGDDEFSGYYKDEVNDPLETLNRGIFKFNEVVDFVLLKPVAKTYVFIVPEFGRDRVSNVLSNLGEPVNMINGFAQGNPERGFTSLWRFILNSTFGVFGMFDFAGTNTDLQHVQEDFGQTLGVWGVDSGAYLVLPLIGPSTTRDAPGLAVDALTNPFNYVESDEFVYGRLAASVIDSRARNLDLIDEIYRNSVDPYATIRSAYLQRRAALVNNQQVPTESVGVK